MRITQQSAQNIVDEMKSSIHRDINIMDENGIILASTNPARQGQLHWGGMQLIREGLPSLTIREDDPAHGVQKGINLPVTIDGQLEGVIGITGNPEEIAIFGDIIKRMTEIMLENARQQEQLDVMERAKSIFVESWLFSAEPDWQELENRGRLLGFDLSAPYTVTLLGSVEQAVGRNTKAEDLSEMHSGLILRMINNHIRQDTRSFCAIIRSKIIILLCGGDRSASHQTVSRICADIENYHGLSLGAGISSPSRSAQDIRRCYLEAKAAGAAAVQSGGVVFYDRVSLEFIVQSIPATIRQDLRQVVFAGCTEQEQRDFVQTIQLYFQRDGDIRACAEQLFLHRNTFQYRMDSIRKKTGLSLQKPKDAMLLYLATQ